MYRRRVEIFRFPRGFASQEPQFSLSISWNSQTGLNVFTNNFLGNWRHMTKKSMEVPVYKQQLQHAMAQAPLTWVSWAKEGVWETTSSKGFSEKRVMGPRPQNRAEDRMQVNSHSESKLREEILWWIHCTSNSLRGQVMGPSGSASVITSWVWTSTDARLVITPCTNKQTNRFSMGP